MRLIILIALVVSSLSSIAETVESSLDFTLHQDYVSARALAMGNAFTAVVDDPSAIFYNPAVLADRKDGVVRGFLKTGFSDSFFKFTSDLDGVKGKTGTSSVDAANQVLNKYFGDSFYGRGSLGAFWARPNWGIAFIPFDLTMDMGVHKAGAPALSVNTYLDTTVAYSYARKLKVAEKWGDFSWGGTLKAVHRIFYSDMLNSLAIAQGGEVFDKTRAAEGLTVDVDLAGNWKPNIPQKGFFSLLRAAKPSFSVVGRNLLDYGYLANLHLLDKKSNEPTKLKRRLDFGSKWDLPNFWVFDPHLGFDVRDVLHDNWSFKKGTHIGAELFWKMFNWWKGYWSVGLNQGYMTYGVGARLALFRLDLVSWGEEVGTDSATIESRRYMLEMSLEF